MLPSNQPRSLSNALGKLVEKANEVVLLRYEMTKMKMKAFMVNVVRSFNAVIKLSSRAATCYLLLELLVCARSSNRCAANRCGVPIPLGSSHHCTAIACPNALSYSDMCAPTLGCRALSLSL